MIGLGDGTVLGSLPFVRTLEWKIRASCAGAGNAVAGVIAGSGSSSHRLEVGHLIGLRSDVILLGLIEGGLLNLDLRSGVLELLGASLLGLGALVELWSGLVKLLWVLRLRLRQLKLRLLILLELLWLVSRLLGLLEVVWPGLELLLIWWRSVGSCCGLVLP